MAVLKVDKWIRRDRKSLFPQQGLACQYRKEPKVLSGENSGKSIWLLMSTSLALLLLAVGIFVVLSQYVSTEISVEISPH